MKFVKTAVAVAIAGIASAPLVATATTTISGVIQVKVQDDDADGTDVNFAAGDIRAAIGTEHELNSGLTGYGNLQLNLDDLTGGGGINQPDIALAPITDPDGTVNDRDPVNLSSPATVSADNVYVGVKGGFGDIRWGEIPLGVEYGQLANDIHDVGDTVGAGISYTGAFGPVSFGLNYSPEAPDDNGNADMVGVGAKFNYGGFTIGLGAEDRAELMNASVGTSFAFAGASIGLQYWTMEQDGDGDDTTNIAAKLGYGIGDLSLGLTFSVLTPDEDVDPEETVIRLDAGYDLGGGMDISTRINSTSLDADDTDDVLYWRVMLTKNF